MSVVGSYRIMRHTTMGLFFSPPHFLVGILRRSPDVCSIEAAAAAAAAAATQSEIFVR